MSPQGLFSSTVAIWCVNGLLALVLTLVGFDAKREYNRNDDQEERLRTVEQACVKLESVQRDIAEMKGDLKILLRRP